MDTVAFLSDTKLAVASAVTANIWRGTAFTMLLLYAALQTVNRELVDAARVDGAGRLQDALARDAAADPARC